MHKQRTLGRLNPLDGSQARKASEDIGSSRLDQTLTEPEQKLESTEYIVHTVLRVLPSGMILARRRALLSYSTAVTTIEDQIVILFGKEAWRAVR